jgi:AbiV family abortive infection protein
VRKPPRVPRWELRNGVVQCLAIVAMRLEEAEVLLAAGFPTQATIVFTFAVEEFGKAVLLRRSLEESRETDVLVVIEGFYDHTAKLEAAATEIPKEALLVGHPGFQAGGFQADAFQIGASADDWKVRLDAMFLDWVSGTADGLEGKWQWGVRTDVDVISKSLKAVQKRLERAVVEWT